MAHARVRLPRASARVVPHGLNDHIFPFPPPGAPPGAITPRIIRQRTVHTYLTHSAVALALLGAACARGSAPATGAAPAAFDPYVPAARVHAPQPTTADITPADLRTRLYIFSDDSMMGREAGTLGNVKGTSYIASEIQKMGLVPAGDDGGYFQTIPLKTRALKDNPTFAVNGAALTPFTDFVPLGPDSFTTPSVPIVFGGTVGDSSQTITDDQAKGKLVVYATNAARMRLRRPGGAMREVPSAAAIAVIALEDIPPQTLAFVKRPREFLDAGASADPAQTPQFIISKAAAARMFDAPLDGLTAGTAGRSAAVDVEYTVTPVADPARNVVGIIPGSDPALKAEYVAIGAHNDHLGDHARPVDHDSLRIWNHIVRPEGADDGRKQATPEQQAQANAELAAFRAKYPHSMRVDSIDNGADDDGSGSVTVLEIAQKIQSMKVKPKRSILFVWHVGEEKGLLGSRWFTDHPTVPRDSIVAQLNMDMVGRGDAGDETGRTKDGTPIHGSPNYLQLVGSRRLSTELGNIVEQVNRDDHHDMQFDYSLDADGHPSNIYCRSDHYEYARYGIPITFFTTGLHSDYHQVTDEPEYIDYTHMAKVGNLVEDIAVHVADLDHRPVVDHPKPDPNGVCRQ